MNACVGAAPPAAAALLDGKPLARLLALLCEGEGDARIVGGALRNAILGYPVHEVDVTTTLLPDEVIARAAAAGLRTIPTGIAHGTVTVLVDDEPFEVTTLREDVETDGRHAVVKFGGDFERDAERRDFTVNALSMNRNGQLYDYVHGLEDLEARRIRFIGEARTRIREDYLRILRFFRFSASYAEEGRLDAEGLAASIAERDGLGGLSKERVRAELFKLLAAHRAGVVIQEMAGAGLLGPLLGLVPNVRRLQRLIALYPESNDAVLRLAALCVVVPEDAERLRDNLRLSNEEYRRLDQAAAALIPLHGWDVPLPPDGLRTLLFERGRQTAQDVMMLAHVDARAQESNGAWREAGIFVRDTPMPRLPFSGTDLQTRGFTEGRALGLALKELQARWIRAGFPQDPHRLAMLLDEVAPNK